MSTFTTAIILASFNLLILLIQIILSFIYSIFEKNNNENYFFAYDMVSYDKFSLLFNIIYIIFYCYYSPSLKLTLLILTSYLLIFLLVKIFFLKKIKVNIDKDKVKVENIKNKLKYISFELDLDLCLTGYKKSENNLSFGISARLFNDNLKFFIKHFDYFQSYNDKSFILLSKIISCENIVYTVDFKKHDTFDNAFISLINSSAIDKSILLNQKNKIKEVYEKINPYGNFDDLPLFFNY